MEGRKAQSKHKETLKTPKDTWMDKRDEANINESWELYGRMWAAEELAEVEGHAVGSELYYLRAAEIMAQNTANTAKRED